MSETLTIFGIDYPNTEGFKAKDDNGDTITYTNGGGGGSGGFIITVTFNSASQIWEPNKTFAEIQAAYNNGDVLVVNGVDGDGEPLETSCGYSTLNSLFWYDIVWYDYDADLVYWDFYHFNSNGVGLDGRNPFDTPATLQTITKTYNPTESQQTETITAGSGYDGIEEVDVTVNAIPSNYVGTGIARKSSTDLTASGATVTAPAGYYESSATKTVASGTEGTPTATKGTVSNHAVSVTPSVTNTAGYISGGTKTGTAVSVSASELVSGTLTISSSGTKDVTNYASASVAAGSEGTPTATKGTVSNHSVSVTPSVTNTAGYISGGTKSGTAVTVTASELASGNKAIVDNGTNIDVVGYSTVSVAIPFSTIYTGSSTPSSSSGINGDIYIKTS